MRHKDFCRGLASEAFSRLIVEMAGKVGQVALRDGCKIGITWHETANALVGIFHRTFLPGRAGIAEPAARADAIFQSPEAGELRAAVKGEALASKGWQRRECSDDLVHDRTGVPALVLDHHGMSHLEIECTPLTTEDRIR